MDKLEAGNYVLVKNADDVKRIGRVMEISHHRGITWYTVMWSIGNMQVFTGPELDAVLVDFW